MSHITKMALSTDQTCKQLVVFEPLAEKKKKYVGRQRDFQTRANGPGSYQNTSTQAAQRRLKKLFPCGHVFVGKSICGSAARRALGSWPQDGRGAMVHADTVAFAFDQLIFCHSICDPWPFDVSSLTLALAPSPPPLPFTLVFLLSFQSALVQCSAGRSRCSTREPLDAIRHH